MANITITSLVYKAILYINLLFIFTAICLHGRYQAIAYDNVETWNATSCETYHTNLSKVLNMSKHNHSCLRVVSPPGMGIRMDLLMVDKDWSIYDYFYMQSDRSECAERIVSFSGAAKPCSAVFNTNLLEIHLSTSITVQFLNFNIDKTLLTPVCDFADIVGLNQYHQSCANLEFYDEIHAITHDITQHLPLITPAVELAHLDPYFNASQLPPLKLPIPDVTCVGKLPQVPTRCSCSLTYQQFDIHCSAISTKSRILLLYFTAADPISSTCSTTVLDISSRRLKDIQTGSFSNLTDITYLLVSNNDLETLQNETFKGLDLLQVLDLSNNRFSNITKGAFLGLVHLSQLVLNGNELRSVKPDMFFGLNNLEVLYLTDNTITTVKSDAFFFLKQLKIVSLRMNRIIKLDFQSFSESLCILDVSNNSVHHQANNMSISPV
ncbi:uncharacterized protein [Amphiura filiformis]|uniref:uncharacterized protein n=1 Tax=Amphiura filiformis TaxID=82378 RepID=UPI003B217F99